MHRAQSCILGLALALTGAFVPSVAHAQYGGGYGGGFNPGFDPSMMPGFGYDFGPDVAPTPGKPGGNPSPNPVQQQLALVNHPAVQQELNLTDDQKAKLKDLASKRPAVPAAAGARKPGPGSSKSATGSSRTKTPGGSNAQAARAAATSQQKQLDDVLNADQRKRLDQIVLQFEGPLAVARQDIAKKINLSSAQVKQVRSIVVEARTQLAQLGPVIPPPAADPGQPDQSPERAQFEQVRQAAEQLQQAAAASVTEVLKPAQKDAFNQLLGPTFDVSKLRDTPAPADASSSKSRPNGQPQPKSRGPARKP
jgi:hypothetical protein